MFCCLFIHASVLIQDIFTVLSDMASTARSKDETTEYFDSPEELDRKVTLLAQWMRESRHMMAFTVRQEATII